MAAPRQTEDAMSDEPLSQEERILRAMRGVLIEVIKDTTTRPGLKHPLSEHTQAGIRECLSLISARQAEIAEAAGRPMALRPVYADEPRRSVIVDLEPPKPKDEP